MLNDLANFFIFIFRFYVDIDTLFFPPTRQLILSWFIFDNFFKNLEQIVVL
jgi:hypothetical protein